MISHKYELLSFIGAVIKRQNFLTLPTNADRNGSNRRLSRQLPHDNQHFYFKRYYIKPTADDTLSNSVASWSTIVVVANTLRLSVR